MDKIKMYILVCEDVPEGYAWVAVAHASLAAYLKFADCPETVQWLNPGPFYKVVCSVSRVEFEAVKAENLPHVVITESALDGREVAMAFAPRSEWPKRFRYFRLAGRKT